MKSQNGGTRLKPNHRRRFLFLFGLAFACLTVFTVEIACRHYMNRLDPDPVFYHGLMTYHQPPLDWALRPGRVTKEPVYMRMVQMTTNTQGFRYPSDLTLPKPADTIRIFVLGASAGFGLYVFDDETFSAQLELYLKRIYGKVEVVNACVPGYTTTQELQLLVFRVLPYSPDVVILFDGFNDLSAAINADATLTPFGWDNDLVRQFRARRELGEQSIYRLALADATVYSGIARTVRHLWIRTESDTVPIFRAADAAAIENYKQMVQTIGGAARGRGCEVIVAPQPNLYFARPRPLESEADFMTKDQKKRPKLGPLLNRYTPLYAAAAGEAAVSTGARFADLTELFKNQSAACFLDLVHPTPYGHLLIAQRLLEEIESMVVQNALFKDSDAVSTRRAFEAARERIMIRLAQHDGSEVLPVARQEGESVETYLRNIRMHLSQTLPHALKNPDVARIVSELEKNPNNGLAHRDFAKFLAIERAYEYAVIHYQTALLLLPREPKFDTLRVEMQNNLGYMLYKMGRLTRAGLELTEAMRLDPKCPFPHFNMGLVYLAAGDLPQSRTYFIEALRLKPEYPEAKMFLDTVDTLMRRDKNAAKRP